MQLRPRLAEAFIVFVVLFGGVASFFTTSAYRRQQCRAPLHDPLLQHRCRSRSQMSGSGGGIQEPATGIDTKAIDAIEGIDTKGIYGYAREIVQQEEAEAPLRRLRLIAYTVPALIAIFLAGISLGGMAGLEEFKEVSENLPNPLVDAGIVGLSFYLWVEEVKTKRSSLALLKKEYEEKSKVQNRSVRRQKKAFGKNKKKSASAAAAATRELPPSPPTVTKAANGPTDGEVAPAPKRGGMFDGVRETLEAVNKQSYYQALALNKELEEKGVLPPLERKPSLPGGAGKVDAAEERSEGLPTTAAGATRLSEGTNRRKKGGKKAGKRNK